MRRTGSSLHLFREHALTLRLEGHTYAEIGTQLGVCRQRVYQLTQPPSETQEQVRARGACERCANTLRVAGHIHHRAAKGMTPETYNAENNLALLCQPCHRVAHQDPAKQARRHLGGTDSITLRGCTIGAARLGISLNEYTARREAGERWCSGHKRWEPESGFIRCAWKTGGVGGRCIESHRLLQQERRAPSAPEAVAS